MSATRNRRNSRLRTLIRGELAEVVELLKPTDSSRLSLAPANTALNKPGDVPEGPGLLAAPAS